MRDRAPHRRFFVLTGAPGAGTSAVIDELSRRGFATIRDPFRTDARDTLSPPRRDPAAAAETAIRRAVADHAAARTRQGPVFFDRGLLDALVARRAAAGGPLLAALVHEHPYANPILFAPPPLAPRRAEAPDGAARAASAHEAGTLAEAARTADTLAAAHRAFGYRILEMPRADAAERADWLLARIAA